MGKYLHASNWIVLILMILLCNRVTATTFSSHKLNINNGLSNNSVRCIYQDYFGFIWIGTHDGLNRYDGSFIKVYRNKLQDQNSIPSNYVNALAEDDDHNLWVCTSNGIVRYSQRTDKFYSPKYVDRAGVERKFNFGVNDIVKDTFGNLYIGSNTQGFFYKEKTAKNFVQVGFRHLGKVVTNYKVTSLRVDSRNQVWFNIFGVGLFQFNRKTNSFALIQKKDLGYITLLEHQGSMWLGDKEGLIRFTTLKSGEVRKDAIPYLKGKNIFALLPNRDGRLSAIMEGGKMEMVDPYAPLNITSKPSSDFPNGVIDNYFSLIFRDKEGRIWIGSYDNGIKILDSTETSFKTFKKNFLYPDRSVCANPVSCFVESNIHDLWIGTTGAGVAVLDRKTNTFRRFFHELTKKESISHNDISDIIQDRSGKIWISTYGGGINLYIPKDKSFKHYCCYDVKGQKEDYSFILYEDHIGNVWVMNANGGGIHKYNAVEDRFDLFDSKLTDISSFTEDADGQLWAGNDAYLIKIDKKNLNHSYFKIGKPVRSILEDREGNLWVGSEGGGLLSFDKIKKKVNETFFDVHGLCNNSVLNILEDKDGFLWLTTFGGLSKFDLKKRSFHNFYQSDGLMSNQFAYNAASTMSSGELVVGGMEGFSIFDPKNLRYPQDNIPKPYIYTIRINNSEIRADHKFVVESDGMYIKRLEVPFSSAHLSLCFSSIDFDQRRETRFTYYLEGSGNSWSPQSSQVTDVNFANLSPGDYRLHVRRSDNIGGLAPDYVLLDITVLPPWYLNPVAFFLYFCIIALLVWFYNNYRVKQTKLRYDLFVTKTNSENEKNAAKRKMAFFTRISHEFRTPLMLIINPLKDLLQTDSHLKNTQEINVIQKNAERLLTLVDQMIAFRRADSDEEKIYLSKFCLVSLTNNVIDTFSFEANRKKISISTFSSETVQIQADRDKVYIILFNIISNALKYTEVGGSVSVSICEDDKDVNIEINDNGIGIASEVGDKLFDEFYQVSGGSYEKGFGIGLYLVKKMVEQHQGIVSYKSILDKGTSFFLTFPKRLDQFVQYDVTADKTTVDIPYNQYIIQEDLTYTKLPEQNEVVAENKSRILIVEDNSLIRDYLIQTFYDEYIVFSASGGISGLDLAKKKFPDLIISDLMMSEGDGFEFCRAVKSNSDLAHIPFISLSGADETEKRLLAIEYGADDYIIKPFDKELLKARVKNLIGNRKKMHQYFVNEITHKKQHFEISEEYIDFLKRCINIIEDNLTQEDFNIKRLSSEIGMSHSTLYRKVRSISGQSVAVFIRSVRLRKAAELMVNSTCNVNEIAISVGINDVKYFRKQFFALFGMNPLEYIKAYRLNYKSKQQK